MDKLIAMVISKVISKVMKYPWTNVVILYEYESYTRYTEVVA